MPYPQQFTKVTFGGSSCDGQEIWSCGFSIADDFEISVDDVDWDPAPGGGLWSTFYPLVAPAIGADIATFIAESDSRVPAGTVLEYVKFAQIGVDGKQTQEPVIWNTTTAGGGVAQSVPQVSVVVTMDSGKWRDPGKYNRFYLPTRAPGVGAWKMTLSEQNNMADNVVLMIEAINVELAASRAYPAGGFVKNVGQISALASTASGGFARRIESIRIGDIYDTQRRRRNALVESYVTKGISDYS